VVPPVVEALHEAGHDLSAIQSAHFPSTNFYP
jgi:hypothetical protein